MARPGWECRHALAAFARGCGHALAMPPGVGSGEAGARWGVSGGGGEGAGGCGHALAALRKCNQVWVVAKPGWGGVWAVGVVRAGGCGHALAAFKHSQHQGNASQVWV